MKSSSGPVYLGFDVGTQGIKVSAIDKTGRIIYSHNLNYDSSFPEYGTEGGMHFCPTTGVATSPCLMWVKALDSLCDDMKHAGFDFSVVSALSGSGQQHGSVYWRSDESLSCLDKSKSLAEQLEDSFTLKDSPIWADSSTQRQCKELENSMGGAGALARLSGSRAYERFTANQIRKIYQEKPEVYAKTEHISLVSSFFASIFLGKYAPIDSSDAAGMNSMDLYSKTWFSNLDSVVAPNLRQKLGAEPVHANSILGEIGDYFVQRYGFSPNCRVVAWSGDNPCSLIGLAGTTSSSTIISLGTSDTVFRTTDKAKPHLEGHVFPHPTSKSDYMLMICYKNGSHTREVIKGGDISWQELEKLLTESENIPEEKKNESLFGFFFLQPEITPNTRNKTGIFTYSYCDNNTVKEVQAETLSTSEKIRACVVSRFLAMYNHMIRMGVEIKGNDRILVTGGASKNRGILQVISDIFQVDVYTAEQTDSASLGAAMRASYAITNDAQPESNVHKVASPKKAYPDSLFKCFAETEESLVKKLVNDSSINRE